MTNIETYESILEASINEARMVLDEHRNHDTPFCQYWKGRLDATISAFESFKNHIKFSVDGSIGSEERVIAALKAENSRLRLEIATLRAKTIS